MDLSLGPLSDVEVRVKLDGVNKVAWFERIAELDIFGGELGQIAHWDLVRRHVFAEINQFEVGAWQRAFGLGLLFAFKDFLEVVRVELLRYVKQGAHALSKVVQTVGSGL